MQITSNRVFKCVTHAAHMRKVPVRTACEILARTDDKFAVRIPKRDVGAFPPNGGTPEYLTAKHKVESTEDWYEYHTDFLPEELAYQLNSNRGGFVSQRRIVKLPCAAPRNNSECIERLCDLLTTSCPQTQLLLQKEIDRLVVGSDIK